MKSETKSPAVEKRPAMGTLLTVFLTVFIDLLGFGIVLPLLPIYAKHFASDFSPLERGLTVGCLMASFSAMQFLFMPVWGRMSDRIGRRPVLLLGLAGSVCFYALFGLATLWGSLAGLFVARIGAGIAGATIATAQACIADCTTSANRAKGMALIGAAFGLGFCLGPILGGVAMFWGPEVAYSPTPGYAASALSAVAFVLAYFLLPETLPRSAAEEVNTRSTRHASWLDLSAWSLAFSKPLTGRLICVAFVSVLSMAIFESTLSLLIDGLMGSASASPTAWSNFLLSWGVKEFTRRRDYTVLLAFSALGFTLMLAQGFLIRRLAGKVPEKQLALAGCLISGLALAAMGYCAWTGNIPGLLVATLFKVLGFSAVSPSIQSLISKHTSAADQGSVLAVGQSVSSLARIAGPALGPLLLQRGVPLPYALAALVMAVAGVMIVSIPAPARLEA